MEANVRRRWRRAALLLALIILVIAAALFWAARPVPGRDPIEFLPATTHAVVGCDVRPGSEGMRRALREWGKTDVEHLGTRGAELAQMVVDWLGFALDVRKDILPWFGGELLIASVSGQTRRVRPPSLSTSSVVLVLRARNTRRAHASLDRGVKPFARDADWYRRTEERAGTKVTVWLDASGRTQLAYTARDGCVLIGKRPEVLGHCLSAARNPAERLSYEDGFQAAVGTQPREVVAWAYCSVESLAATGRAVLPGIARGWPGVLGRYRDYAGSERSQDEDRMGVLALSLAPIREGAEVRAVYRAPGPERTVIRASTLGQVARFAPEEAVLAAAVHAPGAWVKALLPMPEGVGGTAGLSGRFLPRSAESWLRLERMPSDLLISVLPRKSTGRPALVVAAPGRELPVPPRAGLSLLFPKAASAVVDNVTLLATDEEALKQCRAAAERPKTLVELKDDVSFVVSIRPGSLLPEAGYVREIRVIGRARPGGGEGEISLAVPPRYLLGEDLRWPRGESRTRPALSARPRTTEHPRRPRLYRFSADPGRRR